MHRSLLYGLLASVAGLLLLFAFVPGMPRTTGVPPHRMLEMFIFWAGQWLAILGVGQMLATTSVHRAMAKKSFAHLASLAAALGVLIAVLICLLSLTNLLHSTISGTRLGYELLEPLRLRSATLFPREVGYFFYLPLGLALVAQFPLLGCLGQRRPLLAEPTRPRYGRLIVHFVLLGLLLFFLTMCLMAAMERSFLVGCVATTWIGSFLFVLLAIDQVYWSLPEREAHGQPFPTGPSEGSF